MLWYHMLQKDRQQLKWRRKSINSIFFLKFKKHFLLRQVDLTPEEKFERNAIRRFCRMRHFVSVLQEWWSGRRILFNPTPEMYFQTTPIFLARQNFHQTCSSFKVYQCCFFFIFNFFLFCFENHLEFLKKKILYPWQQSGRLKLTSNY